MFHRVECLIHVHEARKYIATVPLEMTNALYYEPGAHCSALILLAAKLELVQSQQFNIQSQWSVRYRF